MFQSYVFLQLTNSLESTLICICKYLTRKLVIPDEYNLKYDLIPLDSPCDTSALIESVGFPMLLKPTGSSGSLMVARCDNEQEVKEVSQFY